MNKSHYIAVLLIVLGTVTFWLVTHKTHVAPDLLVEGAHLPEGVEALPRIVIYDKLPKSAPPPAGYIEYSNNKYGFSFYHSPESTIEEHDEGGGAMTITQENLAKGRGLQIFIIPYNKKTITLDRFLADVPNGVRMNPHDTKIAGEPAITFNSYVPELGATREVWFIHKGHLYEVTTFQGMGDWFVPIMNTWKFL